MAVDKFIVLSLLKEAYDSNQGCIINCSECEFSEECTKLDEVYRGLFKDRLVVNT